MRLIRAAGQNVSPSDDGRLYDQIFSDGLFTDTAFAALGTNNVQVGAMYGDLCGRDFTIEQQTIAVPLPEGDGETTGYIYVEIDTSAETPLSVGATLAPFTPTYEDINVNGAVAQMIVAEYTASAIAVTSVTATYTKAAAGSVKAGSIATVESSPVTANHAIGEYILYGGTVYRVMAAIATGETIVPGTNVIAESVGDALTELNNGLTAYTDGVWIVRKYDDGTAECWSHTTISTNINQTWGSWYINAENTVDFPSGLFVSLPVITISTGGTNNSIPFLTENTTKNTLAYRVARPASQNVASVTLHAHAIGRWK